MTDLRSLPNIGSVVASELEASGIPDADTLKELGSVGAAVRLRSAGYDVCRSKLSGLEGAVRGIRWNLIAPAERKARWDELSALTQG